MAQVREGDRQSVELTGTVQQARGAGRGGVPSAMGVWGVWQHRDRERLGGRWRGSATAVLALAARCGWCRHHGAACSVLGSQPPARPQTLNPAPSQAPGCPPKASSCHLSTCAAACPPLPVCRSTLPWASSARSFRTLIPPTRSRSRSRCDMDLGTPVPLLRTEADDCPPTPASAQPAQPDRHAHANAHALRLRPPPPTAHPRQLPPTPGNCRRQQVETSVEVFPEMVGNILGRGGSAIRNIRERTGASVRVEGEENAAGEGRRRRPGRRPGRRRRRRRARAARMTPRRAAGTPHSHSLHASRAPTPYAHTRVSSPCRPASLHPTLTSSCPTSSLRPPARPAPPRPFPPVRRRVRAVAGRQTCFPATTCRSCRSTAPLTRSSRRMQR